jgi:hypothetical protein
MRMVPVALLLGSLGLGACGGSSSESPWPVEPLDAVRGPKGELLPGKGAADLAGTASPDEQAPAEGAESEGAEGEQGGAAAVPVRHRRHETEPPARRHRRRSSSGEPEPASSGETDPETR